MRFNMTKVTKKDNTIIIDGHANYAEYGQDIVCAAVSTLAQTLICSLEQLTDIELRNIVTDGFIKIVIEESTEGVQLLVDSFFIGIEGVAVAYPEYVMVAKH